MAIRIKALSRILLVSLVVFILFVSFGKIKYKRAEKPNIKEVKSEDNILRCDFTKKEKGDIITSVLDYQNVNQNVCLFVSCNGFF